MADKMQRFTQRARRVLSLAQEEAERLQHSYIGTEHLLLGLMREEGGVAGRVLKQLGLDIKEVEAYWQKERGFESAMNDETRSTHQKNWKKAIRAAQAWAEE